MSRAVLLVIASSMIASPGAAQSLFELPVPAPPERLGAEGASPTVAAAAAGVPAATPAGPLTLSEVSLTAIDPPTPREFRENDLVTIIVSERTKLDRQQSMESDKTYSNEWAFRQFIDLLTLLEMRVEATNPARLPAVNFGSKNDFDGEVKFKKEDRLTDRIQAKVLEVKPNGTLIVEARRVVRTDEEETIATLSGLCRTEDVTDANTVQSNQLYDLTFDVQSSGEMKRSTKKGLIPRVLETLFNF